MLIRMLPPVAVAPQKKSINGRSYSGAPGSAVDIPDFDADILAAEGWIRVAPSGPTSARPTPLTSSAPYIAGPGSRFYDTTLGALIVFDGVTWRSPVNGSAV
jgi:hypothetical protein